MPSYKAGEGAQLTPDQLLGRVAPYASRFQRFLDRGYTPHYWQILFHTLENPETERLCRYRHLVAGRRGGKTFSAAHDVLDSCLFPEDFHFWNRGIVSDAPLHVWVLTKDHKVGRAPLKAFREVIKQAGLKPNVDYKENRGDLYFEFSNGSLVEFKTAVDPQSLRGAGLDIMWIDEAAFITTSEAYDVARPALSDKIGQVICTTTPDGKNWYYTKWFHEDTLDDPTVGRVEYTSIDNPYFERVEWEEVKRVYHPLLFKQEFQASFDSMAGKDLPGDWLTKNFYKLDEIPTVEQEGRKKYALDLYFAVDPAISLNEAADHFAMALIGITKDKSQVFLLETYKDRLLFPDQLDIIAQWYHKYRPHLIGIEAQAYQAALAQMTMQRSDMPPVVPMLAKGKKHERILAMSSLFKIGKVRVRAEQRDFIEEWINYDSALKNPNDDLLDAVEIALRTAGALLPLMPDASNFNEDKPAGSLQELADRQKLWTPDRGWDEHMGDDW